MQYQQPESNLLGGARSSARGIGDGGAAPEDDEQDQIGLLDRPAAVGEAGRGGGQPATTRSGGAHHGAQHGVLAAATTDGSPGHHGHNASEGRRQPPRDPRRTAGSPRPGEARSGAGKGGSDTWHGGSGEDGELRQAPATLAS